MLQVKNIKKEYRTGSLVQKALDDVSLNLRDNEFVAILGPSGSGKTTLLNIIGGLDRYDSGDIIINGISTKKYKDRDWDSYRNHTIGFVFQSYNLIPHQNILANVELALTISGIGKAERRRRATEALEAVGLGDQLHKKPNQMSGGQMQRVAIARALVNDPDILLADEPTGALDSETSLQVMELLREVASDRLVVMVTHNPDLANQYANRIVTLKDGKITSDSNPFTPDASVLAAPAVHRNMGKSSMSLPTSFGLSLSNLLTKKARTILTAFAGSIGIIGIALILALSNGANDYIDQIQEDTLAEYPLQIYNTSFSTTALLTIGMEATSEPDEGYVNVISMVSSLFSSLGSNDLTGLKEYLDSGESGIEEYSKAVEYVYDITPYIYLETEDSYRQVNPDETFSSLGFGSSSSSSSLLSSMMSTDVFSEMPSESSLYEDQYELVAGSWPSAYNEVVVVLTSGGSMSDLMMYALGLRDASELDALVQSFIDEDYSESVLDSESFSYEEILGTTFKLVCAADFYAYDSEYGVWTDKSDNESYVAELVENGTDIVVVGIVQPTEDALSAALDTGICYTSELIDYLIDQAYESDVVQAQLADTSINVLTGEEFGSDSENAFDMESLFAIDEDAILEAFSFDTEVLEEVFSDLDLSSSLDLSDISLDGIDLSSLIDTDALTDSLSSLDLSDSIDLSSIDLDLDIDTSSLDLSGIDLSSVDISIDTSSLPELDLSSLLSEITISTDGLGDAASELMSGYAEYISESDILSSLASGVMEYLTSDEAMAIMSENIAEIVSENGSITISTDLMEEMMTALMTDYITYLTENGETDSNEVMIEYLQTASAQVILSEYASQIFGLSSDISIDSDQLEELAQELAAGYSEYASENSLTDISALTDSFSEYLATDEAQEIVTAALLSMIDLDSIEEALSEIMAEYMEEVMAQVMDSVTAAIEEAIAEQMASVMEQIEEQITAAMAEAMEQVMAQIESAIEEAMTEVITELASQLESGMEEAMTEVMAEISSQIETALTDAMSSLSDDLADAMSDAFSIDEEAFADAFQINLDEDELTDLLISLSTSSSSSYTDNLEDMGYVDPESPSEIDIYPIDFAGKESIMDIIDAYNDALTEAGREDETVSYTDTVGTLMSSVTDIINTISYVLIAFVAISLVVSSIMIGVITYISVLERRKEIGILRAMGASKGNISSIFNAETMLIGLTSGLMGVGISCLLTIPGNYIIHVLANTPEMDMVLLPIHGALLVLLSVVLTLIGGLIPSMKAANSDPVAALRSD